MRNTLSATLGTGTLLLALASIGAPAARAQDATPAEPTIRLAVRPESKLWIEGSSNLHDWSCKAGELTASIDVAREFTGDASSLTTMLRSVHVKVPSAKISCGHGKMDDNLRKALRANEAPEISYILGKFDVVPGAAKDAYTLKTVGTLRVAGKEQNVSMDVTAQRMPDGGIRAAAEVPLKMTDFGIKPPTALLGTLRTADQIKVKFELLVGPQTTVAAAVAP